MYIYSQEEITQSSPMYIRQSYGDRLQDDLDYGVDGALPRSITQGKSESILNKNQTTQNQPPKSVNIVDDKYLGMTKKQIAIGIILGVATGYFIYKKLRGK